MATRQEAKARREGNAAPCPRKHNSKRVAEEALGFKAGGGRGRRQDAGGGRREEDGCLPSGRKTSLLPPSSCGWRAKSGLPRNMARMQSRPQVCFLASCNTQLRSGPGVGGRLKRTAAWMPPREIHRKRPRRCRKRSAVWRARRNQVEIREARMASLTGTKERRARMGSSRAVTACSGCGLGLGAGGLR